MILYFLKIKRATIKLWDSKDGVFGHFNVYITFHQNLYKSNVLYLQFKQQRNGAYIRNGQSETCCK